ncbi:sirohydrochlorin ferrochelatase, chloroplastic-like isoform X2 [Punica granatum]|uniref:Sirohydrochlorin ferrochelatase, chloroplastic-like isoform X2 n=1 Tax=Punica granatum TaxID=22663 RepID=A0A6P8CLV2_PUNGR|nr:sirohydrochlorin ferrochelatase, chloroplastic-like isoform X2 [Punica granatum]
MALTVPAGSLPISSPITAKRSSSGEVLELKQQGRSLLNFLRRPARTGHISVASCSMSENGGHGRNSPVMIGEKDGLIIVDHGSRRQESNLMLNDFVAMFKDKTGYPIVEPAHMLAEPSIQDAFCSCVQKGALRVIVSPFFLFPGRHWHKDIPALTAEAAKEHPGVLYMVTAPLGLHELLVDVVNDRIKHCLRHAAGDADECAACAGTGKCRLY